MFTKSDVYISEWLIDTNSSSVIHPDSGEARKLGEYQFQLLLTLARNPGKIFTREELTEIVWQNRYIGNNSLPNAIHALRMALGDNGRHQQIIKTIPKKGYCLDESYLKAVTCENGDVIETACVEGYAQDSTQFSLVAHRGYGTLSLSKFLPRIIYGLLLVVVSIVSICSTLYFKEEMHPVSINECSAVQQTHSTSPLPY